MVKKISLFFSPEIREARKSPHILAEIEGFEQILKLYNAIIHVGMIRSLEETEAQQIAKSGWECLTAGCYLDDAFQRAYRVESFISEIPFALSLDVNFFEKSQKKHFFSICCLFDRTNKITGILSRG